MTITQFVLMAMLAAFGCGYFIGVLFGGKR